MKHTLTLFLILLTTGVFAQDSTYYRWIDGSAHIEVTPDSVVGTNVNVGPVTAYNRLTGEQFIRQPDSTWEKVVDLTALKERPITTVTDSMVTLDDAYYTVLCDATSNDITINLPPAASYQGQYNIKMIATSGNTVTIDASGAETIDGDLTQVISNVNTSVTIVSDGTNWYLI